jgi:hypothetical protein
MRLKSDFIDYYDHEFIGRWSDDYMLLRPSVNPEMPRERMFELLSLISTPLHPGGTHGSKNCYIQPLCTNL